MGIKVGVGGSPNTIQQWKKEQKQEKKKPIPVNRSFVITTAIIALIVYFVFTVGTLLMIDIYHKSTLKRVIRVEKKLDASNKQLKWLRQSLGVSVKGRVRDGSRLDKLDKFINK